MPARRRSRDTSVPCFDTGLITPALLLLLLLRPLLLLLLPLLRPLLLLLLPLLLPQVAVDPDIQAPELLTQLFGLGTQLLLDRLPDVWAGRGQQLAVPQVGQHGSCEAAAVAALAGSCVVGGSGMGKPFAACPHAVRDPLVLLLCPRISSHPPP